MSTPTILVVDDEEYIQRILSFALTAEGFEVETASDGEEALEMIRECRPDVVVLDLMLPVVDGLGVLRSIRENRETNQIPVVVLSAKGRDMDRQAALQGGANDYVTKPFNPARLIEKVQELLASTPPRA